MASMLLPVDSAQARADRQEIALFDISAGDISPEKQARKDAARAAFERAQVKALDRKKFRRGTPICMPAIKLFGVKKRKCRGEFAKKNKGLMPAVAPKSK